MIQYVKSPLNYVGGKFKLLPQILPHLSKEIGTFVDLFAGGCNVNVNVDADTLLINDKEAEVIELMKYFHRTTAETVVSDIEAIIEEYRLSNTSRNGYTYYGADSSKGVAAVNKEAYTRLRKDFNSGNRSPQMFFTLLIYAFNNQIRYNAKGEFNMPVNKRDFNGSVRGNILNFVSSFKHSNITFTSKDYRDVEIPNNAFVYADPPYLITTAAYNEQGGWTESDERDLLTLLDELNERDIKFALSNVLEHKGRHNTILAKWAENYNVIDLNHSYSNANYQSTKRDMVTREVLITNYESEAI
jgi:DNA adenine methylase Dam